VISPHPEAIQEPKVSSIEQKTLLSPRKFPKGFRSSTTGTKVKNQILEQKIPLDSYHLRNYKDFRSSVPGTGGQRPVYIFSFISQTSLVLC